MPSTDPISSHFTYFLYVTGILLAVALVVNPRVGGLANVLSPCGPFKWTFLRNQQFLLLPHPPLVLQPEVMSLYLPDVVLSGVGLESLIPKVSLLIFIHHVCI